MRRVAKVVIPSEGLKDVVTPQGGVAEFVVRGAGELREVEVAKVVIPSEGLKGR